jgi:hypothetical protein
MAFNWAVVKAAALVVLKAEACRVVSATIWLV